jgi:hypothetical protein
MKKLMPTTLLVLCILVAPVTSFAGHTRPSYGPPQPCVCGTQNLEPCYDDLTGIECNMYIAEEPNPEFIPKFKGIKQFAETRLGGSGKGKAQTFDKIAVDLDFGWDLTTFTTISKFWNLIRSF